MMIIMSMVWVYISELRPLTGLLFIPHVIYENGRPWWNDMYRVNSYYATTSRLLTKKEELEKEIMNFVYEISLSYTDEFFNILTCRKILWHEADGMLRIFIAIKKPLTSTGFEPANLG
jgi:hypothetical protein